VADGWIKLYRQIQEHWIWKDKPYDNRSAWLDILMSAFHKESKTRFNKELITVERGSFPTSERDLAEKWGWSKTKARNFLKLLENDEMIIQKADNKKTIIKVLNYSVYQELENHKKTTERPQKDQQETSEEPLLYKKNDKNDKNDKNKDKNIKKENPKVQYAEFVTMTNDEYEKLLATYGETVTKRMIEILDNYKGSSGKKYSSDYRAILNWVVKKYEQERQQQPNTKPINNMQNVIDDINWNALEG
jgi:hypothetical protein